MANMRLQELPRLLHLMRFDMRGIVFAVALLLATSGVAWAGKEAYSLVLNKEKEVCAAMLKLFNTDRKKRGAVMFEEHKDFIQWERVEVNPEPPYAKYCSQVLKARFDINNDAIEDLVLRTRQCVSSQLTDQLYVFPSDSTADESLRDANSQVLGATENMIATDVYHLRQGPKSAKGDAAAIGGIITLEPFRHGSKTYIAMSDLRQEWIVVARYLGKQELEDVCYFHGKALPVN